MNDTEFSASIKPFIWLGGEKPFSVLLNAGTYKPELFDARADEGWEGNGYDWGSLAKVYLEELKPELADAVNFDPEAGMFCAYSSNEVALQEFAVGFKEACENDELIRDLFWGAELD